MNARATISPFTWAGPRRHQRRHEKDGQTGQQDPAPSQPVAERAERQQQAGEDQDVRVHDPLELAGAGPEVLGQGGQRDVEDRAVQAEREQADHERTERPPPPRVVHDSYPLMRATLF
jgi:hypothetical protein